MKLEMIRENLKRYGFTGPHRNPIHGDSGLWEVVERKDSEKFVVWATIYYMKEMIATYPVDYSIEFTTQIESEHWTTNFTIFSFNPEKLDDLVKEIVDTLRQYKIIAERRAR